MKIGIIGQGYVGSAIKNGFEGFYDIETYDKHDKTKTSLSLADLVSDCEVIFVCVPTPMNRDGSCNTNIVESVVEDIDKWKGRWYSDKKSIVVIKSTIPPGTTNELNKRFKNIHVIFNPEFLTEANFIEDFKNQNRIILGGTRKGTNKLRQIYTKVFPKAHIIKTGSITAEMIKYLTNTFLSTKVSFANEMYLICEKLSIDYDKVIEYSILDDRLGVTHWSVPGPDGDFGFGGHCFPKDLKALLSICDEFDLDSDVLRSTIHTNNKVRKNRDWEKMKGRAVTE
tara:strand:- start:173 stop:1021 length:849 start_codon:yes stop_codon:yes gene_type:complete